LSGGVTVVVGSDEPLADAEALAEDEPAEADGDCST